MDSLEAFYEDYPLIATMVLVPSRSKRVWLTQGFGRPLGILSTRRFGIDLALSSPPAGRGGVGGGRFDNLIN